jgi:hypothetical protein
MGLFSSFMTGKKKAAPDVKQTKIRNDATRQYRYSFSGADAKAYVYFEGMEDTVRQLEALHTISVSVHEAKGQARALGFRGIKGMARGVRTVAGSIILTVIEDNPLRPLMENLREYERRGAYWPGWSVDRHEVGTGSAFGGSLHFSNRIAPLLPPCNILLKYVSEGSLWSPRGEIGTETIEDFLDTNPSDEILQRVITRERQALVEGAGLMLRNVEFIDEGIVTSVNDVVSEVTLSFIAIDVKPLSAQVFDAGVPSVPVDEDQRKDWLMRQKLFSERDSIRVIKQQTAIQTVTNPGLNN